MKQSSVSLNQFKSKLKLVTFLLVVNLAATGCSLFSKNSGSRGSEIEISFSDHERKSREISDLVESFEFKKALTKIEDYEKHYADSPFRGRVLVLKARAYEGDRDCERALENYKLAQTLFGKKVKGLSAEIYFRSSYCYEVIGKYEKAVSSLMDARLRKKDLLPTTREAELPARLAIAYTYVGNKKEATRYIKLADAGVEYLRRSKISTHKMKNKMPEVYYNMGRMNLIPVSHKNFELFSKAFTHAQEYLLRAVEYDHPQWSYRAADELIGNYQRIWAAIESVPLEGSKNDQILALSNQQKIQRKMALKLLELVRALDTVLVPIKKDNYNANRVHQSVKLHREKGEVLADQRPTGEGLTGFSKELQGLKRQGKSVDQRGKLEQTKPLPPKRLPEKKNAN